MKYIVMDKYGNKIRLDWNEYSLDVFDAVYPFRMDGYCINQLTSTIQENASATGLVSEPQLETHGDPKGVRIECHWQYYVISRKLNTCGYLYKPGAANIIP